MSWCSLYGNILVTDLGIVPLGVGPWPFACEGDSVSVVEAERILVQANLTADFIERENVLEV